jgi:hypothetical protein
VVNTSVTDDFEIFVGVMWARFGKPTERAKSGTVEEFETAYARWMKDRDAVDVMFYFKDTPLPPSRTDPRELQQVLDFKKKLADEALYWEFTDSEELGHKLRLHLLRKARQIVTRQSGHSVVLRAAPAALDGAGSEQDVGFFDLQEDALEAFQRGTESVRRLDQQTRELGSKINARTSELNAVPKKHGQPDVKAIQRIWDNVASDLEVFSERIDLELPLMSEAYRTALDRTADLTRVFMEFEVEDLTALRVLRDSSSQLATTVEGVRHHLTTFRTVVSRIPRFTKAVSKARRRAAASLDQLILELDAIVRMAGVVVESTDDCLTKIEDQDL